MTLNDYIENRGRIFNRDSEFSCPDWCDRFGCKDEGLHISVSIVDVVAASLLTGEKASHLFSSHYRIGASPMDEHSWIQRFSLDLKKPCPFLVEKDCSIYGGRPIICALFPEAFFLLPGQKWSLNKGKFGPYPCLREPLVISERRRSHLLELMEMARREAFRTEFYLFGFSPFFVDLRNTALDVLEVSQDTSGSTGKGERPYMVPHKAFEEIFVRRLGSGGYLLDIDAKVTELNSPRGIEALHAIKELTDSLAASEKDFPYYYEFNERDRLILFKRLI